MTKKYLIEKAYGLLCFFVIILMIWLLKSEIISVDNATDKRGRNEKWKKEKRIKKGQYNLHLKF